jgi:hypothetical protein
MKTKKTERTQVEHIKKPAKTSVEGKGKKPKYYNTVEDTEAKFSGNAKKLGVKLKRGKK